MLQCIENGAWGPGNEKIATLIPDRKNNMEKTFWSYCAKEKKCKINWKKRERKKTRKKKYSTLPGLEPGIPWSVVRCLIHWATGPGPIQWCILLIFKPTWINYMRSCEMIRLWSPFYNPYKCKRNRIGTKLIFKSVWFQINREPDVLQVLRILNWTQIDIACSTSSTMGRQV